MTSRIACVPQQQTKPDWQNRSTPPDRPALTPGLQLPSQLPFEKWLQIGQGLAAAESWSAWRLGDWLIYGENCFEGRYRTAVAQTSLEYKTLRNYAWVARRFVFDRRRIDLSFGHHAEVAALSEPEQDFWLRKSEELGWTRNELRYEVKSSLRHRSETASEEAGDEIEASDRDDDKSAHAENLHIALTAKQLRMVRKAAENAQLSLDTWVTRTLEKAAHNALA